ncbi:hypothetical protein I317_02197 [Kwoniella heveanensis CBS 569]|nr:hypothetical protein I317_02197 [Kwoniella heveanensis CBS 569]
MSSEIPDQFIQLVGEDFFGPCDEAYNRSRNRTGKLTYSDRMSTAYQNLTKEMYRYIKDGTRTENTRLYASANPSVPVTLTAQQRAEQVIDNTIGPECEYYSYLSHYLGTLRVPSRSLCFTVRSDAPGSVGVYDHNLRVSMTEGRAMFAAQEDAYCEHFLNPYGPSAIQWSEARVAEQEVRERDNGYAAMRSDAQKDTNNGGNDGSHGYDEASDLKKSSTGLLPGEEGMTGGGYTTATGSGGGPTQEHGSYGGGQLTGATAHVYGT